MIPLIRWWRARRAAQPRRKRQPAQIMVMFALAFTALAAGVGMAADLGLWLVEWQRLATAADAASVAGARYLVAYSGDPSAMSIATTTAQQYLDQYGFTSGTLSPLSFTSPGARQFRITATRTRQTMLVRLVGINTLSVNQVSTAIGELKADIYASNDVTGSMNATDMLNLKNALNGFVDMLGLDPADTEGPKIAIGDYRGERCRRLNTGGYSTGRGSATNSANWVAYTNWKSSAPGGWCDPAQPPPLTAFSPSVTNDPPPSNIPGDWNPYYPASSVNYQLGQITASAKAAVNALSETAYTQPGSGYCTPAPSWSAHPSLVPYHSVCASNGTSHTAGLATGYQELSSVRARGVPFRKVLILETDGTVCRYETPFNRTQSQNRAIAFANAIKTTPTLFQGVEIFVVMFWDDDGTQSCPDDDTDDSFGSLFPNCPNAASLAAAGPRRENDDVLISISSSSTNTCDHYFPYNKSSGSTLVNAYREILKRIAVGKLLN